MSQYPTDNVSTLVQAITWSNSDPNLCRNMASLGHYGLHYKCALNFDIEINPEVW